LQQQPLPQLN